MEIKGSYNCAEIIDNTKEDEILFACGDKMGSI
jgi:hypothetical protein